MKHTLVLLLICLAPAFAGPLDETRYCQAEPKRTADGSIMRRADVLRAFQKIHPCPSTGKQTGACPRWRKDHIIPLANGGCDAVSNLQWLPVELKQCSMKKTGLPCKDRWERRVYAR